MFLRQYNGWALENAATQSRKCLRCGNTTEHFVYVAPHGPQIGFIFASKPLLGARRYFLACPTCSNLTSEITREQAQTLVRK
jgi:hypothetical protein